MAILNNIGAGDDIEKAKNSKNLRTGIGKIRNRRYVARKGPLVVYASDNGITKAFRNIPGVDLVNVEKLNLLKLAPGGHLGRFVIWTKPAFEKLDAVYGAKKGYTLPSNVMTNSDITRIINSQEVQVRALIYFRKNISCKMFTFSSCCQFFIVQTQPYQEGHSPLQEKEASPHKFWSACQAQSIRPPDSSCRASQARTRKERVC